ncbi:MAG: hypothetical protein JOS17DRAFT_820006 [Linnemannia elongata]|nr:MAG: hypothetical protein JOS17DRAFT_820006 [Linnemannia elongata]
MTLIKNPFSRTPKHSTNLHPSPTTPFSLDIPEILERIFSFLNDYTIRWTVALVSRQWFVLNQNRLLRTVSANFLVSPSQPPEDALTSRLLGAHRFCCFVPKECFEFHVVGFHRGCIEHIQYDYERELLERSRSRVSGTTTQQNTSLYAFSPLKELVLNITNYATPIFQYPHRAPASGHFPFPVSLTSLTIDIYSSDNTPIDIDRILRDCPILEHLSIAIGLENEREALSWNSRPGHKKQQPQQYQLPLSLQDLTLRSVIIEPQQLEHVLDSAPKLKALRLIGMLATRDNMAELLHHVRSLPIILETFHLSTHRWSLPEILQLLTPGVAPVTSEWCLWAYDVSPSYLKALELHTPRLTTLELYWSKKGRPCGTLFLNNLDLRSAPALLFKYLCTSSHAVHIKTLKIAVFHPDMDLFGRGEYPDTSDGIASIDTVVPPPSPGIWRCRNLEVLRLDLLDHRSSPLRSFVHSRIVFGYISRVAPCLEELEIFLPFDRSSQGPHPDPKICLQLEGGLCLLGRLRQLRSLRVASLGGTITGSCKEMDLNWMTQAGQRDKFKELRRKEVESWRRRREKEDQQEKETNLGQRIGARGSNSSAAEIWAQLHHLGLLKDVEEMVKEIDVESYRPLPSLEGLAFDQYSLQWPEQVVGLLFPDTRKSLFGRKLGTK